MSKLLRRGAMLVAWTLAVSATTLPACGSMGGTRGMMVDQPARESVDA